jgi:hypothetical protein
MRKKVVKNSRRPTIKAKHALTFRDWVENVKWNIEKSKIRDKKPEKVIEEEL